MVIRAGHDKCPTASAVTAVPPLVNSPGSLFYIQRLSVESNTSVLESESEYGVAAIQCMEPLSKARL